MPFDGKSSGRFYAIFPQSLVDPEVLAKSGKLYSKPLAGVSQLYYQADDGTVYQLTPLATAPVAQSFVYDVGATPSGNLYNDFSLLYAAASVLPGIKQIQLNSDLTIASGVYEFAGLQFVGNKAVQPSLIITGGTLTLTNGVLSLTNVANIASGGHITVTGTCSLNLLDAFIEATSSNNFSLVAASQLTVECRGQTSIDTSGAGRPFKSTAAATLVLNAYDNTVILNQTVASGGSLTVVLTAGADAQLPASNTFSEAGSVSVNQMGGTNIKLVAVSGVAQNIQVFLLQNAYNLIFPTGPGLSVSGFGNPLQVGGVSDGWFDFSNSSNTDSYSLLNENAGAPAASRILTKTGATMVIPAGGGGRVRYDSSNSRWRVVA